MGRTRGKEKTLSYPHGDYRGRAIRIVSNEDQLIIEHGLLHDPKVALQDFCNLWEVGFRPQNLSIIQPLILSYLYSNDELTRIWAYKAVGYSGVGERHLNVLYHVLGSESDLEAQGWLVRSILKLSNIKAIKEICSKSGIDDHPVLYLAANLDNRIDNIPSIDENSADEPTLKWAILNIGYGVEGINKIFRELTADQALEELLLHDAEFVSQFSLWAKHTRRAGIKHMHRNRTWPDSNRRWLNRILMQEARSKEEYLEIWRDTVFDAKAIVREGSYKELIENPRYLPAAQEFGDQLLRENNKRCRALCMKILGVFSVLNAGYMDLLEELLRSSILSAADLDLLVALKVRADQQQTRHVIMVDKSVKIKNVAGSAISIGGNAENTVSHSDLALDRIHQDFDVLIEQLRKECMPAESVNAIKDMAQVAISDPNSENKLSLISELKKNIEAASGMAGHSTKIVGLLEKLTNLAGSL